MENASGDPDAPKQALRYGWTTGTCATAAARAAVEALWTGAFPDPITVKLPGGQQPSFALAQHHSDAESATAAIVKDAGDDPDVTHGALVIVRVSRANPGAGVLFKAGAGVGTVTRPGLPIAPGEPAINPVPRRMITEAIEEAAATFSQPADVIVAISVAGGEKLAEKTLNGRLGIVGGLSILGTTGIVVPFSCSAWIHSIHRGIDVARASGIMHVAGSTGSTSETAIASYYSLPEISLIEMGDFAGGMLKYLRTHPVPRATIAGGFAKLSKLAQGRLDLHSRRGLVDLDQIAAWMAEAGGRSEAVDAMRAANTAMEALAISRAAGIDLSAEIALRAAREAARVLDGSGVAIDVAVFDRNGNKLAVSPIINS